MLNQSDVNSAIFDAVRDFGRPYEGPVEFAKLESTSKAFYTATFHDLRKGFSRASVFSVDVTITEESTLEAVREHLKGRLRRYIAENPVA